MNSNNADGSVRVVIEGDYSKLTADFAKANQVSKAAGIQIAESFGKGFQTSSAGADQAAQSTQKFSQATQELIARAATLKATLDTKQAVLKEVKAAFDAGTVSAEALAAAEMEVAVASRAAGGQLQSVVGLIPGLGRAAEHFINIVPGLGQAILGAFPVLGFIALAQGAVSILGSIGKELRDIYNDWTDIGQAETNALKVQDEISKGAKQLNEELKRAAVIEAGIAFGKEGALNKSREQAQTAVRDAQSLLKIKRLEIATEEQAFRDASQNSSARDPLAGAGFQSGVASSSIRLKTLRAEENEIAKQLSVAQTAELQATKNFFDNQIDERDNYAKEQKRLSDQAAAALRQQQQEFKAGYDEDLADLRANHVVTAQEELTFRQNELADAKSHGAAYKDVQRQIAREVGTLQQEVFRQELKAREDYEKALAGLIEAGRKNEVHEQEETDRELARTNRNIAERIKGLAASGKEIRRVNEREARTQGLADAHDVTMGRLQSERDYGLAVSHTASQQIAYAREIARFDREKIQAELDAAKASRDALDPISDSLRIESENYRIQKLEDDLAEKQFSDDTKLLRLQKDLSIQGQIQLAIIQAEARAINDIANGIADVVVDHKGIGATFKNIGKELEKTIIAAITAALLKAAKDKIFEELAKVLPKTGIIGKIAQALGIGAEDPVKQQIAAIKAQTEATHKQTAETVKSVAAEGGLKTATVDLTGAVRDLIREMAACCACSCESHGKEKPNSSSSESPSAPGWSESGGGGGFGPYTTSGFDPIHNGNEDGNDPYGNFYSNGGVYDTPAVYNNPPIPPKEVVTTTITYGNVSKSMPGPPSVAMDAPPSGMADQISSAASASPNYSAGGGTGDMHFHAHGMTDPDKFIRVVAQKLPAMLKARSPVFSPLSQGAR